MINKRIIIVVSLIIIIGYFSYDFLLLYFNGSKNFILRSDKDNMYERIIKAKKVESNTEFKKLIDYLLSIENTDLLSKEMAIRYVNENKKLEYYQNLVEIKNQFEKIPKDSTWYYEFQENKFRENRLQNAYIVRYLEETIKQLEIIN